jgi:hypothetical protein
MDRGNVLVRIIRNIIRFLIPWVIRGAVWIFGRFVLILASLFTGFPIAARRIADTWVDRAMAAGFPSRHVEALYRLMVIAAWIDLIVSWIIASYVTVWLVRITWFFIFRV